MIKYIPHVVLISRIQITNISPYCEVSKVEVFSAGKNDKKISSWYISEYISIIKLLFTSNVGFTPYTHAKLLKD